MFVKHGWPRFSRRTVDERFYSAVSFSWGAGWGEGEGGGRGEGWLGLPLHLLHSKFTDSLKRHVRASR